VKYPILLVLGY